MPVGLGPTFVSTIVPLRCTRFFTIRLLKCFQIPYWLCVLLAGWRLGGWSSHPSTPTFPSIVIIVIIIIIVVVVVVVFFFCFFCFFFFFFFFFFLFFFFFFYLEKRKFFLKKKGGGVVTVEVAVVATVMVGSLRAGWRSSFPVCNCRSAKEIQVADLGRKRGEER